jgi:hypothetical protein
MVRYFDPWKGAHYNTPANDLGANVLILGESHYERCPEKRHRGYTIEKVRELGQEKRHRFFTMTQKLISGETSQVSDAARTEFWEKVAFCNLIQDFLEAARTPPTAQMWLAAQEPLKQTLGELRPDIIIVLGNRVSEHLPDLSDCGAQVCTFSHPSGRGFQLAKGQQQVREAIQRVGKKPADALP